MDWSVQQYLRFEAERTRPAADLLAAIPTRDPVNVIDLGCGPGNSTELLVKAYPNALVSGLDSSPAMLADARKRLPTVTFEQADLATWHPGQTYDVMFSNAVLHWIPDHASLMRRLLASLAPGGSLAVQVPNNFDRPNHSAMRDVAGPWATKLAGAAEAIAPILSPTEYYTALKPSCRRVDVWTTTYHHVLQGLDGIVDWHKSTGLRPFLARLDEAEQRDYLAAYRERLAAFFPVLPDGTVLLPFPRLFVVASV